MAIQTADNTVYDTLHDTWWDEQGVLNLLRTTVNPWRVPYYARLLAKRTRPNEALTLLDVGCGGGLLAEEYAKLECQVTGVDPSEQSLAAARAHAQQVGLAIDYHCAFGNAMPFDDGAFDVVSCCDVLEHIEDWPATLAEIHRVLKPGGIFLFDTINRTAYSWLVNIIIAQDFPPTRFMPKNLHVWRMFITPDELTDSLKELGMTTHDIVGAAPRRGPLTALKAIRDFKRGRINAETVGTMAAMRPSRNIKGSYMGYATKPR